MRSGSFGPTTASKARGPRWPTRPSSPSGSRTALSPRDVGLDRSRRPPRGHGSARALSPVLPDRGQRDRCGRARLVLHPQIGLNPLGRTPADTSLVPVTRDERVGRAVGAILITEGVLVAIRGSSLWSTSVASEAYNADRFRTPLPHFLPWVFFAVVASFVLVWAGSSPGGASRRARGPTSAGRPHRAGCCVPAQRRRPGDCRRGLQAARHPRGLPHLDRARRLLASSRSPGSSATRPHRVTPSPGSAGITRPLLASARDRPLRLASRARADRLPRPGALARRARAARRAHVGRGARLALPTRRSRRPDRARPLSRDAPPPSTARRAAPGRRRQPAPRPRRCWPSSASAWRRITFAAQHPGVVQLLHAAAAPDVDRRARCSPQWMNQGVDVWLAGPGRRRSSRRRSSAGSATSSGSATAAGACSRPAA